MTAPSSPSRSKGPLTFILLVFAIYLADYATMLLLQPFHRKIGTAYHLWLDSAVLLLVLLPVLYLLVIRPLLRQNILLRRTQSALCESERSFRLLVEHAPVITYSAELQAPYAAFYRSPQMETLLGLTPEAFAENPRLWMDRIHPDDLPRVLTAVNEAVTSASTCSIEYRVLAKDDMLHWVRDIGVVVPGDAGQPSYMQGVIIDITAQKSAEQEIAHLASFPRLNPNPVFELDICGRLLYANASTLSLLLDAETPDISPLLPPDMPDILLAIQADSTKHHSREVCLDDACYALAIFFVPESQTIRVYVNDITQYKRADAARRESETRYRHLFEHMREGMALCEFVVETQSEPADWLILDANPALSVILGISDDVSGQRAGAVLGDERMKTKLAYLTPVFHGNACQFDFYSPFVDKQYVISAYPLGGLRFMMVILDITERKQAEEEMRLSRAMIDNTIEGITISDPNGTILFVNPAFTAITGYTPEEAIGQNPRVLKSDRQDDAFYQEMWRSLIVDGRWQGEIWNRRKNGEAYPEWLAISAIRDDAGVTTHYVAVFHDITEAKQQQERIHYQAEHDALTNLPNRMLYQDRLTQAIARARRAGTALAVMLLDLDRFKSVNDSLGHLAGDVLLQEVAARLRACVRQEDTVARQGGDEFILLLPEIAHPEDALRVANKILDAFQHPFVISGHELYVTVSIGIAIFPTDGNDHGALIQNADVALYQAKEQGRNAYRLYTPAMNAHALERLDMEAHLRRAIEREEFRLVYQPRVHVLTGEITSVEALIRWEHPERGTIPPGQFIPLAEETGLIAPIGEWVLHATHARLRAWHEAGLPPLRVAVNVSGRQLSTGSLIPVLHAIVRDCPGAASLLELEITESVAMTNVEETLAVLRDLHAMGFWIAIDDFGTSYSSLNYLKQFPIHALKVDQSFVREIPGDPNSEAIAATIIGMAHSLQLHVIAEGVETAEQLDFLACHECDEVQGYYYSRPLPPDDFVRTFFVDGAFTTNVPVG